MTITSSVARHGGSSPHKGVTAAELGDHIGVSARAVADLGKRGIAVKAGPGRWRLKESVARYCDDLRRQAKGMGGEPVSASAAAERGRLAKEQADALVLKNARLRGSLLDAEATELQPRAMTTRLDHVRRRALARLIPPTRLPLSEWIKRNVVLPQGTTAVPGPMKLWPYQRAIADSI